MMIESAGLNLTSSFRADQPAQKIETVRQKIVDQPQDDSNTQQVQPEELLNQIKALTEDGLYSVRFEQNDEVNKLVVKIVDTDTDEVIRQIPLEEMLNLSKHLQEISGNIVKTVS